jgi:hypothetical protein
MKKFFALLLLLCLFNQSPAQFFEITFDDTAAYISAPGTTVLAGWLKNITNNDLHIKMIRLQNNLPTAFWSTSMCLNVCFPPNVDSVSTMDPGFNPIPAGDSVLVDVVVFQLDTIPATATIRIKYATMDDAQIHYQWFEASSILSNIGENKISTVSNFKLLNNYPNPFNNQTIISARIDKPSKVTLQIFDILGREVFSTLDEISSAGLFTFRWNGVNSKGEELSSGIYFYRVSAQSAGNVIQSEIKKLTLLR